MVKARCCCEVNVCLPLYPRPPDSLCGTDRTDPPSSGDSRSPTPAAGPRGEAPPSRDRNTGRTSGTSRGASQSKQLTGSLHRAQETGEEEETRGNPAPSKGRALTDFFFFNALFSDDSHNIKQ